MHDDPASILLDFSAYTLSLLDKHESVCCNPPLGLLSQVIQWAKDHDDLARRIGQAGQDFALEFLNAEARSCYWLALLTRYAKLLRYKPGRANRHYRFYQAVEVYLDTVVKPKEVGLSVYFEP